VSIIISSIKQEKKCKKLYRNSFLISTIILFCLLLTPSFAYEIDTSLSYTGLSKEEFVSLYQNENYISVTVELPELVYMPDIWNGIFNNVSLANKSIPEIAKEFGGYVYINNPEYAHSTILISQENYTSLIEKFTSLGFIVRNTTFGEFFLDESRSIIGLPYYYNNPPTELTGAGSIIGIIDSGIDTSHPDLIGKTIYWNDVTPEHNTTPVDGNGHGTFVASIAAGTGASSNGKYKGIAPDAQLMVWKVSMGRSSSIHMDYLTAAINDAVNHVPPPDVISLSLGIRKIPESGWCDGTTSNTEIRGVYDAIINAINNNIPVVIAAGDLGPKDATIFFPGCISNVISVGETLKDNTDYWFKGGDPSKGYSNIAIISATVKIIRDGNVIESFSKEWVGDKDGWSGFVKTFQINPTLEIPVTVKVEIEGENKHEGCWDSWEKWDPGNSSKGDAFWIWEDTFYSGSSVAVEVFALPKKTEGICAMPPLKPYWDIYYEPNNIVVNIFSISSPSLRDMIYYESGRGPSPLYDYKPDVTAPGVKICAARASGTNIGDSDCGNDRYTRATGVSFAVPMVSGLVSLIRQAKGSFLTPAQIKDAITHADEKLTWAPNYYEGYGRINVQKAIDYITGCELKFKDGGYEDIELPECSVYPKSANQIRDYFWSDFLDNCKCEVTYDAYIYTYTINGRTDGDVEVSQNDYLDVVIHLHNTGKNKQNWWYVGVEFWNVSDYNNPNTRDPNGRINAYYNGKDGTHGCALEPGGHCPEGVDCSIISEDVNPDGKLDVGETIRVRCKAPALFYDVTTGNQRIMFWVHERDLGQDAANNGNAGNDWWDDALVKIDPASVKAKIKPPPVGYPDTTLPQCQNYDVNYASAKQCREYYIGEGGVKCDVTHDSYITQICSISDTNLVYCNDQKNSNLVLYYRFDEGQGSTVHDSSGNNNDGNINGANWIEGKYGNALNFSSYHIVSVPDNQALDITDGITIDFWIKLVPPYNGVVIHKFGSNECKYGIENYAVDISGGHLVFWYNNGVDPCDPNVCYLNYENYPSVSPITDGNWHHITITFNASTNIARFYFDGALEKTITMCGPMLTNKGSFKIGEEIGSASFTGAIDELKIYNREIDYVVNNIRKIEPFVYIDVDVKNTGKNQEGWWSIGVEFWNVTNIYDPWNTRDLNGRIDAFYDGKSGVGGCSGNHCPEGVDCSIISESINQNGILDVGETIRVRCKAPTSFYGIPDKNPKIMFWVHERDLGQDAANNGNAGNDWWDDALSRSFRQGIDDVIGGGPAIVINKYCVGDINGDDKIDMKDVGKVSSCFGKSASCCFECDINEDGKIDMKDVGLIAKKFGTSC
jgi:subtilisin family serine protease